MLSQSQAALFAVESTCTHTSSLTFAAASLHIMFSRFASAARRAGRQLSTTATAGDGSGFLIASGVGLAAFACVVPRTNESTHDAAPALQADDASRKLLAVSHADELAKIARVKATQPDNIARIRVETSGGGALSQRWRRAHSHWFARRPFKSSTSSTLPRWTRRSRRAS